VKPRRMSYKRRKSIHGFDLGTCLSIKKYSKPRKKSQNRNIHLSGEKIPAERIEMKICMGVELVDVIMDVKFKFEHFQGF